MTDTTATPGNENGVPEQIDDNLAALSGNDPAPVEEDQPDSTPPAEPSEVEKVKHGMQKRINELTRKHREAEAREQALQQHLQELEAKVKIQPTVEKPKLDDFEEPEEYYEALASWKAEQVIQERLEKREREEAKARIASEATSLAEKWNVAEEAAREAFPDYDDVVKPEFLQTFPDSLKRGLMESDIGPTLVHYLCTHPTEVESIAKLSATGQLKALGRLEERLAVKPNQSKAPAPATPVRGAGGRFVADQTKMSDEDWLKARIKERADRVRNR